MQNDGCGCLSIFIGLVFLAVVIKVAIWASDVLIPILIIFAIIIVLIIVIVIIVEIIEKIKIRNRINSYSSSYNTNQAIPASTTISREHISDEKLVDFDILDDNIDDEDIVEIDECSYRLIDVVKRIYNLDAGVFANINKDLAAMVREDGFLTNNPPIIIMAYAYAMRTVTAGLFLQGIFDRDGYNQASNIFKAIQLKTEQTVEFQIEAAEQAYELIQSYDDRLDNGLLLILTNLVEHNKAEDKYNGKTFVPYEYVISTLK